MSRSVLLNFRTSLCLLLGALGPHHAEALGDINSLLQLAATAHPGATNNGSAAKVADGAAGTNATLGGNSSAGVSATGELVLNPKEEAPAKNLNTIPLQKQYVPIKRGDRIIAYKTAYFGKLSVGEPTLQHFTVVFDTGSGHLILPSTLCRTDTCLQHRRYNRTESSSAIDIEYDGTVISPDALERDQVAIAFGTGEVLGEFVQEVACIGPPDAQECTQMRVVLATEMTSDPFGLFVFDGVLGLGLDALTLDPQFSFFSQMIKQRPTMEQHFAVFLARHDGGESEISFGGHEEKRGTTPLMWAPVAMADLGYWQVEIKNVKIGDTILEDCADGSCRAILDTGTSLLGVPRQSARSMHRLLARPVKEDTYDHVSEIDCRGVEGNMIHFDLGGPVVSLGVEDYSRPTPFNMTVSGGKGHQLFCRSLLLPVDMKAPLGPKVFIWGEPILRRYYTVYDWAQKRIGFTVARQPPEDEASKGLPAVGAPPPGSLVSGAPLAPLKRAAQGGKSVADDGPPAAAAASDGAAAAAPAQKDGGAVPSS